MAFSASIWNIAGTDATRSLVAPAPVCKGCTKYMLVLLDFNIVQWQSTTEDTGRGAEMGVPPEQRVSEAKWRYGRSKG